MAKYMKINLFVWCLFVAHSFFAQNERLTLSKRVIKSVCFVSNLRSLHSGDTLVLYRKDGGHCTRSMKFRMGNTILLKEFTRTYDGKPMLEFKTKGKWHREKGTTPLLILDFKTTRIELQLIDSKGGSMGFVVKSREQKDA